MSETETPREARTRRFNIKNQTRKANYVGTHQCREARTLRRNTVVPGFATPGAFGKLDAVAFNERILGTSGVERTGKQKKDVEAEGSSRGGR